MGNVDLRLEHMDRSGIDVQVLHNTIFIEPATDRAAVEEYWQSERGVGTAAKKLDEYAQPVRVPQVIVRDGGRSYLFEPEELDEYSWDLDRCNAAIGEAELFIKQLTGVRDLRVRHHGALARIEVAPEDRQLFNGPGLMSKIEEKLRWLGFSTVTLDLRGSQKKAAPLNRDSLILPILNANQ